MMPEAQCMSGATFMVTESELLLAELCSLANLALPKEMVVSVSCTSLQGEIMQYYMISRYGRYQRQRKQNRLYPNQAIFTAFFKKLLIQP